MANEFVVGGRLDKLVSKSTSTSVGFSPEERFFVVIETATMSEHGLAVQDMAGLLQKQPENAMICMAGAS